MIARYYLRRAGIGINSSLNLVGIKYNLHRGLHIKMYYGYVNALMEKAHGNYRKTVAVLNFIPSTLLAASAKTP